MGVLRIELRTSSLSVTRSTTELYAHLIEISYQKIDFLQPLGGRELRACSITLFCKMCVDIFFSIIFPSRDVYSIGNE